MHHKTFRKFVLKRHPKTISRSSSVHIKRTGIHVDHHTVAFRRHVQYFVTVHVSQTSYGYDKSDLSHNKQTACIGENKSLFDCTGLSEI